MRSSLGAANPPPPDAGGVSHTDGVSLGTTGTAHVLDSRQTNSELVVARHLVEAHGQEAGRAGDVTGAPLRRSQHREPLFRATVSHK